MLNKDAKEIIVGVTEVVEAVADGFQLKDINALFALPEAVSGWKEGVESLNENRKTPEGRAEIDKVFDDNFDLEDDRREAQIEYALDTANHVLKGVDLFKKQPEPDSDQAGT